MLNVTDKAGGTATVTGTGIMRQGELLQVTGGTLAVSRTGGFTPDHTAGRSPRPADRRCWTARPSRYRPAYEAERGGWRRPLAGAYSRLDGTAPSGIYPVSGGVWDLVDVMAVGPDPVREAAPDEKGKKDQQPADACGAGMNLLLGMAPTCRIPSRRRRRRAGRRHLAALV